MEMKAWTQELNNAIQSPILETTTEVSQIEKVKKIEHTGNCSLKAIGAVSGNIYHFRFKRPHA